MLTVFIGYDERQRISYTALQQSIFETATQPVAVSPLILENLPITRRGLTPFTYSRFLVPWLCGFKGSAIFMDADMLLVSDITELVGQVSADTAVSVVKELDKFEQTSFMLFNCEHPAHQKLTPEFIQETTINLHGLQWCADSEVGALDPKWNQLIGYQDVDLTQGNLHYTMGVPAFPETSTCDGAQLWLQTAKLSMSAIPWKEIMGTSVHVIEVDGVKFPKYVWDFEKKQPKPEHIPLLKKLITEHHGKK